MSLKRLGSEVKVDKQPTSRYRKDEVGLLYNHIQWVGDSINPPRIYSTFIGPIKPTTENANSENKITVIELIEYRKLADRSS